ncbi:MAG TPA: type II toxin-antitoxin system RelE/ParE family toxin [Bryobacteraceae bacterium]|nr:type II toxin-antitoxin system RelE/ParE family toxin [Bryobacteraceae bacterium]
MKAIILHPRAREAIRGFPRTVRSRLGEYLFTLQMGEQLGMPHSRPMSSVAAGVSEVRVRGEDGTYRAFYYTAHADGIIVFHAFVKKTQQTPDSEIDLGRKRLKEILDA